MTAEEVRAILDGIARKFADDFNPPVEPRVLRDGELPRSPPGDADWQGLEARFGCRFPDTFKAFMTVEPDYNIPSVLNVRCDQPATAYDEPRLDQAYDHEMSFGTWNADLVPFLTIGNGDSFCLSIAGGKCSAVYYFDHEAPAAAQVAASFDDWLTNLEWHLNGTGPAPLAG